MPVTTETRRFAESFDGDGGTYYMNVTLDVDRANNGVLRSETVRTVTIVNQRTQYEVNYELNMQGLGVFGSYIDPAIYPPVPAGQTRVWSGLNYRIDNRDFTVSLS